MKNFWLKAVVDGRKNPISASSNRGLGISVFVKQDGESKEVIFINCFDTDSELLIEVYSKDKDIKLRLKKDK